MKIIIVGAGKVGYATAKLLTGEKHDITVVDRDPDTITRVSNSLDVISIEGSGTDFALLEEAGVASADVLIASTGTDETNIVCCSVAKKLAAEKGNTDLQTVARVRDPQYIRQLSRIRDVFEISHTMNPEGQAAAEISRILQFPTATRVDTFSGGKLEIVEFWIPRESKLDGVALKALTKFSRAKVLICSVERNNTVCIPDGDFVLKSGDRLSIAASRGELRLFFKDADAYRRAVQNVLILGGGRIGVYLAQQLVDVGIKVTVIEKNLDRCNTVSDLVPKATVIHGNGTRREVLEEQRINNTDAIAALTGYDEDNIIVSMYAASRGVGKVVTKVNDEQLTEMLSSSGLDCFVTPKQLVAQELARYVRALQNASGSSVETLYRLVDGSVEALEFRVNGRSKCIGIPLRELKVRKGILIAAIIRGDICIIPNGNASIRNGDRAVIVTTRRGLGDLDAILED